MRLKLTDIGMYPCEGEQRHAWAFSGVANGYDIRFTFFDSGNNACYVSNVSGFDYEGPLEDRAILEEAVNNWFLDNEEKTDTLRSGDMIKLDIQSTLAYRNSPRAMSDRDLITNLRENARDCLLQDKDSDAFRKIRYYAEKKDALPVLLREAGIRIEKRGLTAHFQLQNLAPFLKQFNEHNWTGKDALDHLAQIKNADIPAATMRQNALRNYLRRNKP